MNHTLPLTMLAAPGIPLDQAAAAAGISPRTLRSWCKLWPGLAIRTGQGGWQIVDADLLAEMVALRRDGHLTARALRNSGPKTAALAEVPPGGALSVEEAAALLETDKKTIRRYCAAIPSFGEQLPGIHGQWRIDPGVAAIVGAIRMAAGGRIPTGTLVEETERRTELLRVMLTLMRQPEANAQINTIIGQHILKARSKQKRTPPRTLPLL